MKSKLFCALLALVLIAFQACQIHSFLPQTQNVPVFTDEKQGEMTLTLPPRAVDFQLAYSPIKNLGVMGNVKYAGRYTIPEIGLGYYKSINENSSIAFYAGYANCKYTDDSVEIEKTVTIFKDTPAYTVYSYDIYAHRFFVQPQISLTPSKKINLTFSFKTCLWQYSNLNYKYDSYNIPTNSPHRVIVDSARINLKNVSSFSFEPAITLKVGGDIGKFILQTGIHASTPVTQGKNYFVPYTEKYFPLFIRMGFSIFIDVKALQKKEKEEFN